MGVKDNYKHVLKEIPSHVKVVAVSKTKPAAAIEELYAIGQRIFGESKVQELDTKFNDLPKDIEWHMIGHLQTNKVKYMAPYVSLIHSIDSVKLLRTVHKEALKNNRIIPCLLQVHIAEEEAKYGFDRSELTDIFENGLLQELSGVQIKGLMGMATYTSDKSKVEKEFKGLKALFDEIKEKYFNGSAAFSELSMGMSGDYQTAIACGSTMIRLGTTIFGERNYNH